MSTSRGCKEIMTRDDVAIPPKSDQRGSSLEEVRKPRNHREAHLRMRHSGDRLLESAISGFVAMSMIEICYHALTSGKSDFVEISPILLASLPALFILVWKLVSRCCLVNVQLKLFSLPPPRRGRHWRKLIQTTSSFIQSFLRSGRGKL